MRLTNLVRALPLFFLCELLSCTNEHATEGYVAVEGGKIWYKIVGDGNGIPLLVLYGGPGDRSCLLIPGLSRLANERPVIFYDQLGSGRSDSPHDTTLWTIQRFVNEIDYLRRELKLQKLHILGHSCGSAFLIEYLVTKKPEGVQSVIFSSPLLSSSKWVGDARRLLSQLPVGIQDTIHKYEQLINYTSPSFLAATDTFYAHFLSRKTWPYEKTMECENVPPQNNEVYQYMWGPTEFTATGTLKNFDRTDDLATLNVPILFTAGEFDEARPQTMYQFQKLSNNATVEIIENAAHMTMIDQPEKLTEAIRTFLKKVENN
jgi:proline iminopeptidase